MTKKRTRGMRKIPLFIENKLGTVGTQFYAAVVKRIPFSEIQSGDYVHVGLTWSGQLVVASPSLSQNHGRYSELNLNGQVVVRRDLPKIDKNITFVNPRLFGIPGNSCTITQIRKVYQREQLPPRKLQIETAILFSDEMDCIVRFVVDRRFTSTEQDIDRELLFALNLLQESVGGVNVFPQNATTQDYLGSIQVHWEILPAGNRDENIRLILSSFRPKTEEERADLERRANQRYDFFETLGPKHIIRGTGGLNGYMGAVMEDDLVLFEHLTPGNGIYLLFQDWAVQSQRTKTDLLKNGNEGVDYVRIVHTGDWQMRVRTAIEVWRAERRPEAA